MRCSHGLEYRISADGLAVLCGIGICTDEHVSIPSEVDGYPVIGIAEKAFVRCEQIRSVSLPLSVTFIDNQAFAWCRNLTDVRALNLFEIGDRAFIGCDRLSSISFGNKLEVIGEKAFSYCSSLSSVALPDSLVRLGSSAFEGCRKLCRICLSDNLKFIENGTFYACEGLCKVILPSSLEYVDEYAFAYCSSLVEMDVPSKTVINKDAFFECASFPRNKKVS